MIEDTQKLLLTGGVKTNIFRDTKQEKLNEDDCLVMVYILNDTSQLEQAREFFTQLAEVKSIVVPGENAGGYVMYGEDEL